MNSPSVPPARRNPPPIASAPPPLASPPPKQRGCLGVLVWVLLGLGLFMLLLVGGLYYAVMHTSLPFKMIESMFASAGTNANFKVEGISGSISSGFKIKSIRWGQDDAGAGEISDVRVAYSGFWDLISGNRVIFREIHVGKAHLDITGLENFISNANAQPTVTWTAPAPTARQGSRLFQIDKVSIADIFKIGRASCR